MKAFTIDIVRFYYVRNVEQFKTKLKALGEYNDSLWLQAEEGTELPFTEEVITQIKLYLKNEIIEKHKVIRAIPPTDEKKRRTYERRLKQEKSYSNTKTIEIMLNDIMYIPLENFKDMSLIDTDF